MTIGQKIRTLRNMKGMTQEALAEELNVSRSAIAKWENDNGIPEIVNLKLISRIFNVSLDEILDDESCISTSEAENREDKSEIIKGHYVGWYCSIDLEGWNDGASNVIIVDEDNDFLFYRRTEKRKTFYGLLGKKFISKIEKKSQPDTLDNINNIGRDYFCNRNVFIEIACNKGLIKGFFDFTSDDYRNVIINSFEKAKIILDLGREIDISSITKIEEL